MVSALDFSGAVPTNDLRGTLVEAFSLTTEIVETYVTRAFLKSHPDSFDQIVLFLGFPFDLGEGAYAYEVNVKNDVSGIAMDVFDNSARWGSRGKLSSFVTWEVSTDSAATRTIQPGVPRHQQHDQRAWAGSRPPVPCLYPMARRRESIDHDPRARSRTLELFFQFLRLGNGRKPDPGHG